MIIGTAGHVDHGKTELIKALTGLDTDRLKEEKERGISIDIGFAPLLLPNGKTAGVIDVPGHERFIHNMLAGAGGMDLVLMVIDATEGVMPQTREHLDILELLQVNKGLIVITKTDLVEKDWLEMVVEEVKESFSGTFLSDAPLHLVSSATKAGIDKLRKDIGDLVGSIAARDENAPLRIPVDRAFTMAGFGTVITGTILNGTVNVGDTVEVVPLGREFRVRGLQVHGDTVESVTAGQRVAVNLAGLEKKEVVRGSVVAAPGYFRPTGFLDAKLKLLPTASKPLVNMSPVHFYLGTARVVAELLLLGRDELLPGHEGFVQCRLDRPLVAQRGDLFIIRSYSPMITIGGGTVLDESPPRHKRFKASVLEKLEDLQKDDPLPFVLQKLNENQGATLEELAQLVKMGSQQLEGLLERAQKDNKVVLIGDYYLSTGHYKKWKADLLEELDRFHKAKPLWPGMHKARLAGALPHKITSRTYDAFVRHLKSKELISVQKDLIFRKGFVPQPSAGQKKKIEEMLRLFKAGGLTPPPVKSLWETLDLKKEEGEGFLEYLVNKGSLVGISEEIYMHNDSYQKCLEILKEHFRANRSISLANYRDLLQSSRRYAQAILEHFDGRKYTRRLGDERVPWKLPR